MPHDEHEHHTHGHGHHEHHGHPEPQPDDKVHRYYQLLGVALKELLIEKGVVTPDEVRRPRSSCAMRSRPRTAPRSWRAPGPIPPTRSACWTMATRPSASLASTWTHPPRRGREHAAGVHNVIVCTLCSCYPRAILGLPPSWYKSRELPRPHGARAARGAQGIRHRAAGRCRGAGARFDRRHALSRAPAPSGRQRRALRERARGVRHARLHDRRQSCEGGSCKAGLGVAGRLFLARVALGAKSRVKASPDKGVPPNFPQVIARMAPRKSRIL